MSPSLGAAATPGDSGSTAAAGDPKPPAGEETIPEGDKEKIIEDAV